MKRLQTLKQCLGFMLIDFSILTGLFTVLFAGITFIFLFALHQQSIHNTLDQSLRISQRLPPLVDLNQLKIGHVMHCFVQKNHSHCDGMRVNYPLARHTLSMLENSAAQVSDTLVLRLDYQVMDSQGRSPSPWVVLISIRVHSGSGLCFFGGLPCLPLTYLSYQGSVSHAF